MGGAQLGAYNFDFGSPHWDADSYKITLGSIRGPTGSPDKYSCDTTCLEECAGDDPTPAPTPPTPTPTPSPVPSPSPPPPSPTPPPAPTPSAGHCCWGGSSCDTAADCHDDAYCSASESQCSSSCGGMWCAEAD